MQPLPLGVRVPLGRRWLLMLMHPMKQGMSRPLPGLRRDSFPQRVMQRRDKITWNLVRAKLCGRELLAFDIFVVGPQALLNL